MYYFTKNKPSMYPQVISGQCCTHIETSQMIYSPNQMAGCYTNVTMTWNELTVSLTSLLRL